MAVLSRVKTWVKERLYYQDLNTEFDNIVNAINNILVYLSPLSGDLDVNSKNLNNISSLIASSNIDIVFKMGDATGTYGISFKDSAGSEVLRVNSDGVITLSPSAPNNPTNGAVYKDTICQAWCLFDASSGTPSIIKDVNIGSITDNAVGDFAFSFSTNLTLNNYVAFANAGGGFASCDTFSSTSVNVQTRNAGGTLSDMANCCLICVGL